MTPKEKSKELADKFYIYADGIAMGIFYSEVAKSNAKQCALICVNEILSIYTTSYFIKYWTDVKSEIEKL